MDTKTITSTPALTADQNILPEIRAAIEPQIRDYYSICQSWPTQSADPKGTTAAVSDRPTVLISGQFDPITPPRNADIAKETLSNAVAVTIPGGGHVPLLPYEPIGNCGFAIALGNIANPGKPDTACAASLKLTYRQLPASIAGASLPTSASASAG